MATQRPLAVAITGAAGYLGRALGRRLASDPRIDRLVLIDRAYGSSAAGETRRDLGLSPGRCAVRSVDLGQDPVREALQGVDAVCHLAFILGSEASDAEATRVNLDGTRDLLDGVVAVGAHRLVVASSVSAYGALPDNPWRLRESDPLRAVPGFRYPRHKVVVEEMLDRFEAAHPEVTVVRLRICVVLGPPPRSGAVSELLAAPVLVLGAGFESQFVHVDDVAEAFALALEPRAQGAYNVASEPSLSGRAIAQETGQRLVGVAPGVAGLCRWLAGVVGLPDPVRLDYLRHPILVDCQRIRDQLGWQPRYDGGACLRALRPPPRS